MNERVQARRARGERVLHLGFGEAGLPVLPEVADVLAGAASANSYGPVVGSLRARAAAAGYFDRRGLPTDADQILLAVLPGDLVLPQPSWVSYAAQAALVGKHVLAVPIPESAGGLPDPDRLAAALDQPENRGAGILILTLPDNPTGTLPDAGLVKQVCEVADRYQLMVISDEIYRDLCYDPDDHLSPATLIPDRTVVTSGLSKSVALGGWRIGFARTPGGAASDLGQALSGVASEVWSALAAPMQEVAAYVLDEPPSIVDHVAASRRLHEAVATAVHQCFTGAGAHCRKPTAAFYLYPDFESIRGVLAEQGIRTGDQLCVHLLDRHGVAVLPGTAFGDDPEALRFRVATSLLYGAGDQRWDAVRAARPTHLPWIADAFDSLGDVLGRLV
jgi:aspartate aminotransferase